MPLPVVAVLEGGCGHVALSGARGVQVVDHGARGRALAEHLPHAVCGARCAGCALGRASQV